MKGDYESYMNVLEKGYTFDYRDFMQHLEKEFTEGKQVRDTLFMYRVIEDQLQKLNDKEGIDTDSLLYFRGYLAGSPSDDYVKYLLKGELSSLSDRYLLKNHFLTIQNPTI
jgi:uncharacterized protein YfbU (UPF0304 family)